MDDNKKKKWAKRLPIYIIEAVLVIVAIVFLSYITKMTNNVEKVRFDEDSITVNEEIANKAQAATEKTNPPKEEDTKALSEEEEKDEKIPEIDTSQFTGVMNIAFFGVDARDRSLGKGNRSDSIMICSVDLDTHEVKLISVYRDTYLNLGNDSYNKCNAAYAQGGPKQALSMLNMNMDLYITDYVTIGFEGLIKAVDALGGIEIELADNEVSHLNNYQATMADELGLSYIPVATAGRQTLNGLQATAYCRIRYTAGSDFKRAERQRDVLTAMLEKSKTASVGELSEMATAIFPYISTSMDINDIISMLGIASHFEITVSDGFPFAEYRNGGNIGTKGSCVVPTDLDQNVRKLHELLYNEKNYEPSKDVLMITDIIREDTKDYLAY